MAGIHADEPVRDDEIEITSAMVEADVRIYRLRDSRFMLDGDIVEDIFDAMVRAMTKEEPLSDRR